MLKCVESLGEQEVQWHARGVHSRRLQGQKHTFYALHNFVPASDPLSIVVGMLQILGDSESFKYLYDRKCLPHGPPIVYIEVASPTAGTTSFKHKTIPWSLSRGGCPPQTTRISACDVTKQLRLISLRNESYKARLKFRSISIHYLMMYIYLVIKRCCMKCWMNSDTDF
jgi:hypothetical protein